MLLKVTALQFSSNTGVIVYFGNVALFLGNGDTIFTRKPVPETKTYESYINVCLLLCHFKIFYICFGIFTITRPG
jgi:hypothetical protein